MNLLNAILTALHLLAQPQTLPPPQANQIDALVWTYDDLDILSGPVTLFLVCLDGQATATCAQVPLANGVVTVPGTKQYQWKLPALKVGTHNAQVQACTDAANACSPGVTLAFTFQAIPDVKGLKLGSSK